MWKRNEGKQTHESGDQALAVQVVRSLQDEENRQRCQVAARLPLLASLQEANRRSWMQHIDLLAKMRQVLGALAHRSLTGEAFLDEIRFSRATVILVARSKKHVNTWHLTQRERSCSWSALMMRIPAPMLAASDGSAGLAKATRAVWPNIRIQRCIVHVACQVKRYTIKSPKFEYDRELLGIANRLTRASIRMEVRRDAGRPSIGTSFTCQRGTVSDVLSGHAF